MSPLRLRMCLLSLANLNYHSLSSLPNFLPLWRILSRRMTNTFTCLNIWISPWTQFQERSAVNDFAMQLLRTIGYRSGGRFLRSRKDIPLFICGVWTHAKTDVFVMDQDDVLLLVQEDKRHLEVGDPRPQLIAAVIAAVQMNNITRETVLACPLLSLDWWRGSLWSEHLPLSSRFLSPPSCCKLYSLVIIQSSLPSSLCTYPTSRPSSQWEYEAIGQ
jgi:hypothetical protein